MKNSKLTELLSTLSGDECQKLAQFLNSPYFNNSNAVIDLYCYLQHHHPKYEISKEKAYKALYPSLPYNSKTISHLMTELLQLVEKFLSVEQFLADKLYQKRRSLIVYNDRKLYKHYRFLFNKVHNEIHKSKMGLDKLLSNYLLHEVEFLQFSGQKVRRFDPRIHKPYEALNEFYYVQLLKYICTFLSWQEVVSGVFVISKESNVLINSLIESKREDQSPLLVIYLSAYLALSSDEERNGIHFNELLKLLKQHEYGIEEREVRDLYLIAINFCARKLRKGESEYILKMLNIYEKGIQNGALIDNGYLSHWTYTNVVRLGLKVKRYKWTEAFIHEYKSLLPPDSFSDAFHLNVADLYFNLENYDEVLEHLTQLQFSDPSYHLASRLILIKTFYEREDIETLLSSLASFIVFLKRNKGISVAFKKTCLNFCTLLHQLLKNKPKKRAELLEQIKTAQPLAERAWLLKVWEEQKL